MGVVWAATHIVTKRSMAIKVISRDRATDAGARARLLREARASCAVDHPGVVPVIDVIDVDGAPALVMDLLEGESLRSRLDRGPIAPSEACRILAPVASALAAAHAAAVVHRDIKPENVFLLEGTEHGVRVLDFGIAKILATEDRTSTLTETGAVLGTPYYMAPEQAFGERDVGPSADAWALGIVLYECVTGARPTQADNLGQVIKRITQTAIPPLDEVARDVPPRLAALSKRLLERDPATRERDMAAVARELEALGRTGEPSSPPRSRRFARIALAVMSVGLAGAAYAWHVSPSSSSTQPLPTSGTIAAAPSSASIMTAPESGPPAPIDSVSPVVPIAPPPVSGARKALRTADTHRDDASDGGPTAGPGHVIIHPPF